MPICRRGAAAHAANAVFMGTSVISGTRRLLVVAPARRPHSAPSPARLRREPPPTAFAVGVRDFGMLIVRLTVLLVLFVLLVNVLFHRPLLESCCSRWRWPSA